MAFLHYILDVVLIILMGEKQKSSDFCSLGEMDFLDISGHSFVSQHYLVLLLSWFKSVLSQLDTCSHIQDVARVWVE